MNDTIEITNERMLMMAALSFGAGRLSMANEELMGFDAVMDKARELVAENRDLWGEEV